MARLALEQALPAEWIDEVFEANRQHQYARRLMFSTVVELMTLVTLGLRPSLHAAARQSEELPVSLAALYDKVSHTEPGILRGLVRGSAQRLGPVMGELERASSLEGWQLRVVDGNHLASSDKRLGALRRRRGAALPGHSLVVYDPDQGLVCDLVACEDAYESERVGVRPLVESAQPGQLWMADSHFCTRELLQGWQAAGASFIVREHGRHPRVGERGPWSEFAPIENGRVRSGTLTLQRLRGQREPGTPWRCIEIELDTPTASGCTSLRLWSNLPASVDAPTIAALYRQRWRIEGLFGRLESVLHSEIKSLGHPRAALLGFTVAVLAYNVLALLQRAVEQAHRPVMPQLQVSAFHLTQHVKQGFEGLLIAVPPEHWPEPAQPSPEHLARRLLQLAARLSPSKLATSPRGPKIVQPKGWVDGRTARSHFSTARLLKARAAGP
jgi:IS4 transposase